MLKTSRILLSMSALSENRGHCQACDREQMLPNERLSKHGYTVQWQMFVGVCPGSSHPPYELSCDFCKQVKESVLRRIPKEEAYLEELKQAPMTNIVDQVTVYSSSQYKNVTYSNVELFLKPDETTPDRYKIWIRTPKGITPYSRDSNLEEYAQGELKRVIESHHKAHIDRQISIIEHLNDYVEWITERINNWVLKDLKPIERDRLQLPLSKLEKGVLQKVADKTKDGSIYTINDRSSYVYTNSVTYGRVLKLIARKLLENVGEGRNKDGRFVSVKITEEGLTALSQ